MSTPAQIDASRANGAKSKGPVTAQGKLNSSRNRLRHGLLARTICLEDESRDRFRELLDALMDEYHPTTTTQCLLIETMAIARWRLLRIWTLQRVSGAAKAQPRSIGRSPAGPGLGLAVLRP